MKRALGGYYQSITARRIIYLALIWILISSACNLPFVRQPQPTQVELTPTAYSVPKQMPVLSPTIAETYPLPQSTLGLQEGVTFYFDQDMDRASVEGAFQTIPSFPGRFNWQDDATVQFIPDQALPPATPVQFNVGISAASKDGLALAEPVSFEYQTAEYLAITEQIPSPDMNEVNPSGAIVVAFNQPVAALGADQADLPAAFSLSPEVDGQGEWINTSTYVFRAEPALQGGVQYTVAINPELTSLNQSSFAPEADLPWTFTTVVPQVVSVEPAGNEMIYLDQPVVIRFNQPMDPENTEAAFSFVNDQGNAASGSYTWTENNTLLHFTPEPMLQRSTTYRLNIDSSATGQGGTPLSAEFQAEFRTVDALKVVQTNPSASQGLQTYGGFGSLEIQFNAPLNNQQDVKAFFRIDPQPVNQNISWYKDSNVVYINGYFDYGTDYTLTVSEGLQDRWGGTFNQSYQDTWRVLSARAEFNIPALMTTNTLFLSPQDSQLFAQSTNIWVVNIGRTRLSQVEFINYLDQTYYLSQLEPDITWQQTLDIQSNITQSVSLNVSPDGSPLRTGLYLFQVNYPEAQTEYNQNTFLAVVSPVQMIIKVSQDEMFVWAVTVADQKPVANRPITVYSKDGVVLGSGVTSIDGTARISIPEDRDPYSWLVAVLGNPDDLDYSVGLTSWNGGVSGWDFGIPFSGWVMEPKIYLYTDRPIYQPGQTVYFRGIARQKENGRYYPLDLNELNLHVVGNYTPELDRAPTLEEITLPISDYGTFNGSFILPADAPPGTYTMGVNDMYNSEIQFKVAEYRKPEIDLKVNFGQSNYQAGQDLNALIEAKYFFGEAAKGVSLSWSLFAEPKYLDLPGGYQVGELNLSWLRVDQRDYYDPFMPGRFLLGGTSVTDENGMVRVEISAEELSDLMENYSLNRLTLEATLVEEGSQPVTSRAETQYHPADFYIGIRPDQWSYQSEEPAGFFIQTVDWQSNPSGNRKLTAVFQSSRWIEEASSLIVGEVVYRQELTPLSSTDFETDDNGMARIAFTPPQPGVYQVDITNGGAVSQVMIWVGGTGTAIWPRLPNQRIRLESDAAEYTIGQTASIFLPNPFEGDALALVSIERGKVMRSQLIAISGTSQTFSLPILEDDAPNVFVSVTVLGKQESGQPDFRQGYLQINVNPEPFKLQVDLSPQKTSIGPRDTAAFELTVKDIEGNPVVGEFSISAVDKAVLALSDPNVQNITDAFYGIQPLQVITNLSLAAYVGRIPLIPPGRGGGGGFAEIPPVRADFKDTAFWQANIKTDTNGKAAINFPVPDNLTTWVVTVRGLTKDTRVGEAATEIVVSKNLLIRPEAPRFLVAGDHVELAAIVHNNTSQSLSGEVSLKATGVTLDDPAQEVQQITLDAGARKRVTWWVTALEVEKAELVFSVKAGDLADAAKPEGGDLPILKYSAPQSFGTTGVLSTAGDRLEIVSFPRSFVPTGGKLQIELSPSLLQVVISGAKALKSYPFDYTEPVLSGVLANVETLNLMNTMGWQEPDLEQQLRTEVREDLNRLKYLQNLDGGWSWGLSGQSDFYLSAYVLLGLSRAKDSGFFVSADFIGSARDYVVAGLAAPEMIAEDWQLDRQTLAYYALQASGLENMEMFGVAQAKDRLSPWGKALLAMTLLDQNPENQEAREILSNLAGGAIRSSTGVHWESDRNHSLNFETPNYATAVITKALAENDPASPLITDAVRYLIQHRRMSGLWFSSYDTAWTLMALAAAMRGTGDLQANYAFSASLNDQLIAQGEAVEPGQLNTIHAEVPFEGLSKQFSNALKISRGEGAGRLYYRAFLELNRPVEGAQPLDKGVQIEREYFSVAAECSDQKCPASDTFQIADGLIAVRLTVTLPHDMPYMVVQDSIPAGTEILNRQLKTAQTGFDPLTQSNLSALEDWENGWNWWVFTAPRIYTEKIQWVAEFAPAGTYELIYFLQPVTTGEFQVIPAHAYQMYFPDVEGASAGMIFTLQP